jgi:hypothetical protein
MNMQNGLSLGWRNLFHSWEETQNAPPLKFAIDNFLQEDGITYLGALPGHGKTLLMLEICRTLLEGGKLFEYDLFPATKRSNRVLYLVPECSIGPFKQRLELFRLIDHVRDERMFYRTLSSQVPISNLADERILQAAAGADVFLDTAIRFMEGDENTAKDQKLFAEILFNLQRAGARTIVCAHHSPKAFSGATNATLENVLRGSGDVGAAACTVWALKQVDRLTNRIEISNVKARDFEACEPFEIEGRPYINDTGRLKITKEPGGSQNLTEFRQLIAEGKQPEEIIKALDISQATFYRWKKKVQL